MDRPRGQQAVADEEQEIQGLLEEVDEQSGRQESRWTEKRSHVRRPMRTFCEIRFIGPDGETVLYTVGKSREISAGGMSLLSREHFARHAHVLVTLSVLPGKRRSLPAKVVYSRAVRERWYLTGVQFAPSSDDRLSAESYDRITPLEAMSLRAAAQPGEETERSNRRRMLQILATASLPGQRSKHLIAKVVLASMCSDHVIRRAAIPVLLSLGGKEPTLALISMLNDSNPLIQGEAAEALGMIGASQAIQPLREMLRQRDDNLTLRAAEALARMGDWSGKGVIIRLLLREGLASRRAARALGFLVGRDFRASAEGVEEAREYIRQHQI